MAAVTTRAPNTNLAEWKIAIVTHHDQPVKWDVVLLYKLGDSKTAFIHICDRLDNKKTGLLVCAGTYDVMFSTGHKSDMKSAGDFFDDSKSDVMSRPRVTISRIS